MDKAVLLIWTLLLVTAAEGRRSSNFGSPLAAGDEAAKRAASSSMTGKRLQQWFRAKKTTTNHLTVKVLQEILTRQCIQKRGEDFFDIVRLQNWSLARPVPESGSQRGSAQQEISNALLDIFLSEDYDSNQAAANHLVKRMIHRFRSSTRREWAKRRKAAYAVLEDRGFHYKQVRDRCESGFTPPVEQCILEKGHEHQSSYHGIQDANLTQLLQARIDLENLQAMQHSSPSQAGTLLQVKPLLRVKQQIKQWPFKASKNRKFSFVHAAEECHLAAFDALWQLISRVENEVAGQMINGSCSLLADKMCPEGTVLTQRRFNASRAAVGTVAGFVSGKIVSTVAFAIAGFVAGGPVGAASGAAVGMASPTGLIAAPGIGAIAGFVGQQSCACAPRRCYFNKVSGSCDLAVASDKYEGIVKGTRFKSPNPYARLPSQGQKCVKLAKANRCTFALCSAADLMATIPFRNDTMFGRIGHDESDSGVYNCLSTTGGLGGSLTLQVTWPHGFDNSAHGRSEFYKQLLVAETPDSQEDPSHEDTMLVPEGDNEGANDDHDFPEP
mmetsp:Transcript_69684/g.123358  ORF Transcript_69684/g.123358 Transcript_69684/m.123358 type:complete len:555 (+) Transcript_69684:107-1771(+)